MNTGSLSLWGLFTSSFISSTLLPGGSEIVLALLSQQQVHSAWLLILVATIGNTLGGLTTWAIGSFCANRYPPDKLLNKRQQHAVAKFKRWGSSVLLLSWVPILGDPLCFAAGWLKVNFFISMLYMLVGKGLRYALITVVVGA